MASPNRIVNLQTLRYSNGDVAFATAFVTLTTGAFLVGFVQSIGGSDLWIGLLAALPSLCGFLQIPGAIWGRSFASYKRFVAPGGWLWRLFHVPLLVLPVLAVPNEMKLVVLTVCVGLASGIIAMVQPIYNDWLAEMVPSSSRGFYFSRRNAIASAVGAVVGLVGGILLDVFRGRDMASVGFCVVFGIALACSGVSMAFFLKMKDVPREAPVKQDLKVALLAFGVPFSDRQYRKVLVFLAIFVCGQVFAGPLFAAFARESLKLDFKSIQAAIMMHAVGGVATARFWGFLSDRYGNKPLLTLVGFSLALNLIPWALCRPGADMFNTILLMTTHLLMGATWSAVALCQFNLLLATANPEDRANYIGAGMAVQTLVGGLSPLAGAALMAVLRGSFPVEVAYKLVFGVTAVIRIVAMFFLIPVKEEGSAGLRATIRNLRSFTPRGVRAMRSLQSSTDVERRTEALESLGTERMSVAVEDVIKALHDPLPRVRRQAAMALADLDDPRAAHELLHMLEFHPNLVEEETVEALGRLAQPESAPMLIRLLDHPSSLIRRASARALGKLRVPEAVQPLIQRVADSDDMDLRRAALQALRLMEAREAGPVIAGSLMDVHPSVRVAAAEAVSELELMEAAGPLRDSLRTYEDEASSEAVYALGVVGTLDDLPLILGRAAKCESIITRRRCLLAAARLLDVEREAYRLLLLDGIARDTELMTMAKHAKAPKTARSALQRYSAGDEAGGLALLVREDSPVLRVLAETPVEESFLIALAYSAKA